MFAKLIDPNTFALYTMDRDGGGARIALDKLRTQFWTWPSPNGRYVAYRDLASVSIWSAETAASIPVGELPVDKELSVHLAWSPNGLRIAWVDGRQLKVLSLDGGVKPALVELPEPNEIGALTWSPDDEQIAYVLRQARHDRPSPDEVWTVSPRGSGAPQKLIAAPLSRPLLGDLTWHPNGQQLVATGRAEDVRKGIYEHWVMENFLPARATPK